MKKILVVDESQAVRETIHLVLGRDFVVTQKASLEAADYAASTPGMDLLIVGVSPAAAWKPSIFSDLASQFSCAVLFLVDSSSIAAGAPPQSRTDCLVKPFNPYELKQKAARLLAESLSAPTMALAAPASSERILRYLDYPYVPASVSTVARKFAQARLPLLILAEAGCGQESLARAVHALGNRPGPWLSMHCSEVGRLRYRIAGMLESGGGESQGLTIFLSNLDSLDLSAQSSLLDFLAEAEEKGRGFRLMSSSRADLLEKASRGEFLDALYYRLATLSIRLPALRDRQADIPILAERLAQECSAHLGLGKVSFSPAAMERLRNYLWFGNVNEMESVIARTLAVHRKEMIDAPDLILGDAWEDTRTAPAPEPRDSRQEQAAAKSSRHPAPQKKEPPDLSARSNGYAQEVRILISELAHELKNPMVTVKTFSQLLGDRFDDPTFRVRFQQTVNGDIQRMDDLLEALVDFSQFSQPAKEKIFLYEQLRRVEEELLPECIKREAALQWGKRGEATAVFVDKAQFVFAFKNILRAALGQVKPKSEIQIDVEGEGGVAISYLREAAGISALSEYLGVAAASRGQEALPLRVLLANILLERNGGAIKVDYSDEGRARIRAELPVV